MPQEIKYSVISVVEHNLLIKLAVKMISSKTEAISPHKRCKMDDLFLSAWMVANINPCNYTSDIHSYTKNTSAFAPVDFFNKNTAITSFFHKL